MSISGEDPDDRARHEAEAREEEQWQAIVANYGERPDFPGPPAPAAEPEPQAEPTPEPIEWEEPADWQDEDRYVPPPPPPVQRPRGWRLVAWLGVLGVPLSLVLIAAFHIVVPAWGGVLALGWFIGGFGYLVSQMRGPDDPDSGWDNGAVL